MITKNQPILTVHKEYFTWRIVGVMLLLLGGMGAALVVLQNSQELRGRATAPEVLPTPLQATLPPTELEAPYMRLIIPKTSYGFDAVIPVDVYVNTGGKPTMEASVVVEYDTEVFTLDQNDIEFSDVFKSAEIDLTEEGKVTATLFVTPSVGHTAVTSQTDVKVATFRFKTKTLEREDAEIGLAFGGSEDTSLTLFGQDRAAFENILTNVSGVKLSIAP